MQPEQPEQTHSQPTGPRPPQEPVKLNSNPTLTIAVVASAVLLLAAIGLTIWLTMPKSNGSNTTTSSVPSGDADAKSVKKVSFVVPDIPANYVKRDNSRDQSTNIFYYDDSLSCGITQSVLTLVPGKTAKDLLDAATQAAEAQGVKTDKKTDGPTYKLKGTDGKDYTFNSLELLQTIDVPGASFKQQNNILLYKEFGSQVASLGYACKSENWGEKSPQLASIVRSFTVKTEK